MAAKREDLEFVFNPRSIAVVGATEAGFPVYPTVGRAALAIGRFLQYHQARSKDD